MLKNIINNLINFLIPKTCVACNKGLYTNEESICISCINTLPYTNSHTIIENFIYQKLYNLTGIENAYSFLYFEKDGQAQKIIHNIKYGNQSISANYIGKWYAAQLKDILPEINYIIPVPLHKNKKLIRGYNQSEEFANGLNTILKTTVNNTTLFKTKFTQSQTKKDKQSRYQNLIDGFSVVKNIDLNNKHILLVDDVITTGATIEACCNSLSKTFNQIKITVVSIAIVK